MSISFHDDKMGATFKEAIVILESLLCVTFEDEEVEEIRRSTAEYVEKKLWHLYPYDSEQYFEELPNPRPEGK